MTWRDWIGTVQNMDCLEGMKQMPKGCVDIVMADPIYNIGKNYGKQSDTLSDLEYADWYMERAREISRVLADHGFLYVSSLSRQIFEVRERFEAVGLRWFQILIWYGPNMIGGTTAFRMPWTQMYEPITVFIKGKRRPMINTGYLCNSHDVFVISRPQRNFKDGRHHPTQKPLELYKRIIARTPGDIILDPFMGSGTTAVACKQLGRRFIGFEINPKYVDICNQRLAQGVLGLRT